MVRVCQCKCGKAARNYYTKADYYLDRQELAGRWGGSACPLLGLPENEEVSKKPFDLLTDNRHPITGEKLTVRQKDNRTPGYDINFHVSKSVSLLYAMTGDPDILDSFRWAVDQTMRSMEAHMKTRVRKDGQCFDRLVGNMAWATFVHLTARPILGMPDPHLHTHCFCFNAVFDAEEQRWKAGQFREIKQQAPRFQALFRSLLGTRLAKDGYQIEWKGDDFEIAGFTPELLKKFSRRTQLIESEAVRRGIFSDKLKDSLGAQTREKKHNDATMPQLRELWRRRMTDDERQIIAQAVASGPQYRRTHPARPRDAWEQQRLDAVRQRQRRRSTRAFASESPTPPPPARRGVGYG
jgi:conjugative relaxase-like TrwC/TraI family protein